MSNNLLSDNDYKIWLADIKSRIRNVQIKAALKVNAELLKFYWELGADIVVRQEKASWGDGLLQQLSKDLIVEFPNMKGFSVRNLKYIRQWHLFYSRLGRETTAQIGQQLVAQLPITEEIEKNKQGSDQITKQLISQITGIPWGHNIVIITKCKNLEEALYYVQNTKMIHR